MERSWDELPYCDQMKEKAVCINQSEKERDRKKEEMTKPNKLQFGEMGVLDFQGSFSGLWESVRESTVHIYINTHTLTHTQISKHNHMQHRDSSQETFCKHSHHTLWLFYMNSCKYIQWPPHEVIMIKNKIFKDLV